MSLAEHAFELFVGVYIVIMLPLTVISEHRLYHQN